jgi:CMP-N,N'-diacetyllegionaminic acid synthase
MAQDDSPDFGWVEDALATIEADAFAILRPTSPFRTPESLQAAWESFRTDQGLVDSLRAVRPAREHPGKMWRLDGDRMKPLLPNWLGLQPWHSHQTANLRVFHVQTSSLEIAWTKTVSQLRTISGVSIKPWLVTDPEGFTLDYPEDWERAEAKITAGEWALPSVTPN